MILKEMEEDLILSTLNKNEASTMEIQLFNDEQLITKDENDFLKIKKIESLEKVNDSLTFVLLKHKEAMKEIIKQTYKEFIKRLNLEKIETVKILLQEFNPFLHEKEGELQKNKIDSIQKLQFQESLLLEILKEIDEQKKQYKDISLKLDLSVKLLKEQTFQALKKFQFISFDSFYASTLEFLRFISTNI
jgi:hypothetical protein